MTAYRRIVLVDGRLVRYQVGQSKHVRAMPEHHVRMALVRMALVRMALVRMALARHRPAGGSSSMNWEVFPREPSRVLHLSCWRFEHAILSPSDVPFGEA